MGCGSWAGTVADHTGKNDLVEVNVQMQSYVADVFDQVVDYM